MMFLILSKVDTTCETHLQLLMTAKFSTHRSYSKHPVYLELRNFIIQDSSREAAKERKFQQFLCWDS